MRLSLILPIRKKNKSLDNCLYSIKKHTKDYELIIIEGERGYNAKVNEGIRKAKGDYLIFLHDDHQVCKNWANELAEVGSFRYGELGDKFDHWGALDGAYLTDPSKTPDYPSALCVSKEAMNKIGFVDEFYEEPGYQDVDLGFQIKDAGYKIKCLSGKIIHWSNLKQLSEKNKEYLKRKHVDRQIAGIN